MNLFRVNVHRKILGFPLFLLKSVDDEDSKATERVIRQITGLIAFVTQRVVRILEQRKMAIF